MTRMWAAMLTVLLGAAVLVASPATAAASDGQDTFGFVDPETGVWYLQGSFYWTGGFYYGNPGDYPFMGDWDCDGVDTPGLYRQSDGYVYLRNSNTQGIADVSFFFGNPGDVPIAGDFNADGCDTVSIYRPSEQRFYVINQLGTSDGGLGAAEYSFLFGNPGDKPFVGDFNGNGQDTIGLHRESTGLVYFRNTNTTGIADNQFYFGDPGDRFMAGDWTGDGTDTPGLFRPYSEYTYLRYSNTQGNADVVWPIGESGWVPVAGKLFNCDNQTSIPASECEALVALHYSTARWHWEDVTGWLTNPDPCAWYGVDCEGGTVQSLSLDGNRLDGSLPPELGTLANLTRLNLSVNSLEGAIPPELGNLNNLEWLLLDGNFFTGPIPPELGNLANLDALALGVNQLSGPIPPELGKLTNLTLLWLPWNRLAGPIPPELGNLTNLDTLNLTRNNLSGPVPPELTNLTNLLELLLYGQHGCLTAATPSLATWLTSFDPYWNNGCPVP